MKTNKKLWYCLFISIVAILFSTTAKAQVTIGTDTEPKSFSVLELIENQKSGETKNGLRLPQLTTAERDAMTATTDFQNNKTTAAKGLMIYNKTIDCVEYWDGTQWISNCDKVDCITPCDCDGDGFLATNCGGTDPDDGNPCNPGVTGITASRMPSGDVVVGTPVTITVTAGSGTINNLSADGGKTFVQGNQITVIPGKVGTNAFTIRVNNCPSQTVIVNITSTSCSAITNVYINTCGAIGDGESYFYMFTYSILKMTANTTGGTPISYQWYVDNVVQAGATASTFDFSRNTPGTYFVKCSATNACGIKASNAVTEVRVVQATLGQLTPIELNKKDGGHIYFSHVNLGAENNTDPCLFGDLYQWGRKKDGHQFFRETITTNPTIMAEGWPETGVERANVDNGMLDPVTGQVKQGSAADGKFIKGGGTWRAPGDITLWGYPKTANDPCPSGWRVPTLAEWASIATGDVNTEMIGYSDPNVAFANTIEEKLNSSRGGVLLNNIFWLKSSGYGRNNVVDMVNAHPWAEYWTTATSGGHMGSMYICVWQPGVMYFKGAQGDYGLPVRCLQEPETFWNPKP